MPEQPDKIVELAIGQLDKRLTGVEQNLLELRTELAQLRTDLGGQIAQLRTEVSAEFREVRTAFRWVITTMVALFAVAVPVWMWVLSLIIPR